MYCIFGTLYDKTTVLERKFRIIRGGRSERHQMSIVAFVHTWWKKQWILNTVHQHCLNLVQPKNTLERKMNDCARTIIGRSHESPADCAFWHPHIPNLITKHNHHNCWPNMLIFNEMSAFSWSIQNKSVVPVTNKIISYTQYALKESYICY